MPDKRENFRNIEFPRLGMDVSLPYFDQRPDTSPSAVNVRAYDGATDRLRGGSRQGLTPFLGRGSTSQVSGFHRIQSLSCIVTADQAATFQNTFAPLTLRLDYSETDSPPVRNAPRVEVAERWFQGNKPTFTGITGVIVGTPDGGGTGQGEATFKIETDGITVTLTATFLSAGFPGPYAFVGHPQVQTVTQPFSLFFNPAFSVLASDWTVVAGSFIAILPFNLFYSP
jgi:hypothetical protein